MTEKDTMRRLMEKFRFAAQLPAGVRKGIPAGKKSGLVAILRARDRYGVFVAPVIGLFFLARRMGISLSMAKCTLIIWGMVVMAASTAASGVVYAVKHYRESPTAASALPGMAVRKDAAPPAEKKSDSLVPAMEPAPGLGVVPFEFIGVDADLAETVTKKIGEGLIGARGARKVAYIGRSCSSGMAKRLLLGTVVKLGDGYRITARVVDASSSRIISFASEKIASIDEIEGACGRISQKVQGAVE
ncbi:MAG TPA: FlgO family outer membrane protein [Spirochaetota bacterium]|nr:FlgO family outer membrane protein [Spirochaetota bacterium]